MPPLLSLWQLQNTNGDLIRLTGDNPANQTPVPFPTLGVWVGGVGYYCVPIIASGVERAVGDVPSARLVIGQTEYFREKQRNLTIISPGTRVTRIQTDATSLDNINFPNNRNPYTNSPKLLNLRKDVWIVTRLPQETSDELTVAIRGESAFWNDIVRPDVQGRCYHKYRGTACGYNGNTYWDGQNNRVASRNDDNCALSIKACELRFPTGALPYGGVPEQEESSGN